MCVMYALPTDAHMTGVWVNITGDPNAQSKTECMFCTLQPERKHCVIPDTVVVSAMHWFELPLLEWDDNSSLISLARTSQVSRN